ncbi:hypothetical protein EV363DRAFT_1187408 [Boletus edulis]|nr:hypothetical protein EV363DRAFT_1187408 [Boletus edulis]
MTHICQPALHLTKLTNRALRSAYAGWDATGPNEPLSPVSIIIDGHHLRAIRRTDDSSVPPIPDILHFESAFKAVIRAARQANMNLLLHSTLGALVVSRVVPFLPETYADSHIQQSSHMTMIPRIYTLAQKNGLVDSVTWNAPFGCPIWHHVEGNRVLWFACQPVRDFLAILLSQNENNIHALGVRHMRRNTPGGIASWGPVNELDNTSVLALLAKLLASLSVSVLYDIAQQSLRPHHCSDAHRNSQINGLAEKTFQLLLALDDVNLEHHDFQELHGDVREEGHAGLLRLKKFLGFVPV